MLFLAILLISCGYALVRGGAPERVGAGLQIAAFALNLPVHWALDAAGYESTIVGTAVIDVVLLVALSALAWRSTRFWPIWIAGWQLAAVLAHLAKLIDPDMLAAGYAIQAQIWAYPMAIATGVGAWRHRSRVVAGDDDFAWKSAAAGSRPSAFSRSSGHRRRAAARSSAQGRRLWRGARRLR